MLYLSPDLLQTLVSSIKERVIFRSSRGSEARYALFLAFVD